MTDKAECIEEIRELLHEFTEDRFDDELSEFANRLLDKLGRMRKLDITRGRPHIWAGAIAYLIARLNFLFDQANPLYMSGDEIAADFDASKSSLANKAGMIEKQARLYRGHPEFCRSEITDMMTIVKLPHGIVMPMTSLKEKLAESGQTADVNKDGSIDIRKMNQAEIRQYEERLAAKK